MRKVYQVSSGSSGWIPAILISVSFTLLLFCIIPFSHVVAKPKRILEIRKTSLADLPPPAEAEAPPPPPPEQNEEEAPPPLLAEEAPQPVPLMADLDAAMGSGGILPGLIAAPAAAADVGKALDSFDVSELEQRPQPVSQVSPGYPAELRKAKIEGTVTVAFVVTEDGRVDDPRVEKSSRPEFEKYAIEAIRKWRFKPGMKEGKPVQCYLRQPFRFRAPS